jgi:hypothetical protein
MGFFRLKRMNKKNQVNGKGRESRKAPLFGPYTYQANTIRYATPFSSGRSYPRAAKSFNT